MNLLFKCVLVIIFLKGVIFLNITTISSAYIFLAIFAVEFISFLYYIFLVGNTRANSEKRSKIIGTMKDPEDWRRRNNIMAYICLFWSIVSIIAFIYLKFFSKSPLISIVYVFGFLALIVVTVSVFLKHTRL